MSEGSKLPSTKILGETTCQSAVVGGSHQEATSANVKEVASGGSIVLQPALSTSSAQDVPIAKDEAGTATMLKEKAIRMSLSEASLDRELQAMSEKMSQRCYHQQLQRSVTFADAMLRDLFGIRHLREQEGKLGLEVQSGLFNILILLRKKGYISADFVDKTHIELILRRIREPKWGFSMLSRLIAESLYQRFERQKWGQNVVAPSLPTTEDKKGEGKRKRDSLSSSGNLVKQKKKIPLNTGHIKMPIPKEDDPIFGANGPMRGTLIKYNTSDPGSVTKSIVLNPESGQVMSKVYGHNGITIGRLFLRQMAALAQGAHGSSQAGISGTAEDGAFSVIVTSTYKALEKDGLERFEYCASGSMDNTFKNSLVESQGYKALRTSLATREPVRVLRGPNDNFRHAPSFGLRYDGLYTVVEEKRRHNTKGGLYAVFIMERVKDQDPVDLSRPNTKDFEQLAQLKKMLE